MPRMAALGLRHLFWRARGHNLAAAPGRDELEGWTHVQFMQNAVVWWRRDLSKHDAARTRAFLEKHSDRMKPFARKIAGKYLRP